MKHKFEGIKKHIIALTCVLLTTKAIYASATPLNFSDFQVFAPSDPTSVLVSAGTVTFSENESDSAISLYNYSFSVPMDAVSLSFGYELDLLTDGTDYLQFIIDGEEKFFTDRDGSGNFSLDLSLDRGRSVFIAWGLLGNDDTWATTVARIFDIDLTVAGQSNPVPEPATMLLMVAGLACLSGLLTRRKS